MNLPLRETKKIYSQRIKFSEKVLKEYSIFYLIINNLDVFNEKIEIISEIKFSNTLLNDFKNNLISCLASNNTINKKKLDIEDCNLKFAGLVEEINKFAPVNSIAKDKDTKYLISIFHEILEEIREIELNNKIQMLESRVAKEMDEKLYEELLSLKSHLKSG